MATLDYPWFPKVAKLMIREMKSFATVVDELELPSLQPKEMLRIEKSEGFQAAMRNERHKYANEVANDPRLGKSTAIGMMMLAVERLMLEGEWDKALEGLQKLSKLAGWQGVDNQVNIFADLKGKEIEDLKREIGQRTGTRGTSETVN